MPTFLQGQAPPLQHRCVLQAPDGRQPQVLLRQPGQRVRGLQGHDTADHQGAEGQQEGAVHQEPVLRLAFFLCHGTEKKSVTSKKEKCHGTGKKCVTSKKK